MTPYLIAEVGINHNGDLRIARQLIQDAAGAGFDAVKFQKRTIDLVYAEDYLAGTRESPWGTTQRAQKEGLEFGQAEYEEIDSFCHDLGIDWTASAWDVDSQQFLGQFDLPFNKVGSAMLGHQPLLAMIAKKKRKTFISTGMVTLDELDQVVEQFRAADCPFELMHCNSTYPMREEDANLLCIPMLRQRYGCDVGYSGHESSLLKICTTAVALGATSLERHITLDRAMYGSDQAASVETHALRDFVETVRKVPSLLGTGEKSMSPDEQAVREKLRIEIAN